MGTIEHFGSTGLLGQPAPAVARGGLRAAVEAARHAAINDALARCIADGAPPNNTLVLSMFADTQLAHGQAAWLSRLFALLTPFGMSERTVRTSVFRLVQQGLLQGHRNGRRSAYSLTPEALAMLPQTHPPIPVPEQEKWDGDWTLVMDWSGGLHAAKSAALARQLYEAGYRAVLAGVHGRPAGDPRRLDAIIERLGLQGKLIACRASDLAGMGHASLRKLVERNWDLSATVAADKRFIDHFGRLRAILLTPGERIPPARSFVTRIALLHAMRRIRLADPQLPPELLPANWLGDHACALARQLLELVWWDAERYAATVLSAEPMPSRGAARAIARRPSSSADTLRGHVR